MMPYAVAYVIAAVVSFRLFDSLNQMLSPKTDRAIHRYYVFHKIKLVICAIFWPIRWTAMIAGSALALIIAIIRYSLIKITATHKENNH